MHKRINKHVRTRIWEGERCHGEGGTVSEDAAQCWSYQERRDSVLSCEPCTGLGTWEVEMHAG